MRSSVLDSYTVLAFLFHESGSERVTDLYTGDPEFRAIETDIDIVWLSQP